MIFVIIKNTFYFYILIHSIFSLLSLLICIDNDIDHFEIQCPRMSNSIKEFIAGIFKPFLPEVIEFLVGKILMQDLRIVNALIFSGILEVVLALLGAFYYIMVETPKSIQKSLRLIAKLFFFIGIILWIAVYCSGIGLRKLLEIVHIVYQNPQNVENYTNDFSNFIQMRQEEIMEYYF
ncbi:unnamed protein product (macronuclear) [Paramecium tetraurelia]|uniref:Uncharacterized protein n=1 Tax=Paramecium tetraurelia TaxID=5888 RepID=A0DCM4_PARTE|nr:uncharacterized protein GSPATT00015670001 [Paramecium tetraurelia]CAK80791.1 unnamed protein product [Paramecium tetraurelia]|eukprot:XP_001448188.1 hypothetical protein (macronuclear) [Paramecium tetraurelia strain d4-2]